MKIFNVPEKLSEVSIGSKTSTLIVTFKITKSFNDYSLRIMSNLANYLYITTWLKTH